MHAILLGVSHNDLIMISNIMVHPSWLVIALVPQRLIASGPADDGVTDGENRGKRGSMMANPCLRGISDDTRQ